MLGFFHGSNAPQTICYNNPMIWLLLLTSAFGVLTILLADSFRRRHLIGNELARKSVHITHALIIGSWPFFTNYKVIIAAEVFSFGMVFLARVFDLFGPLREVKRLSWGEFFFPLAVIVLALLEPSKWLFLAAVLHFGLADGFAAIVGNRVSKGHYKIFGHHKSIIGTTVFWLVSFGIVIWFMYVQSNLAPDLWPVAFIIPTVAALIENISPWGSDNFTVPIAAYCMLVLL